jgi:hypothetical protein
MRHEDGCFLLDGAKVFGEGYTDAIPRHGDVSNPRFEWKKGPKKLLAN